MKQRNGRVCILTGASRGLGAALAPRLAASGLKLALVARSADGLAEVTGDVVAAGGIAKPYVLDLTDLDGLPWLVEQVTEQLGPPVVLINNAGIEGFGHFADVSPADIQREVTLNVTAALVLTRLVLPHMLTAGEGQVVNLSSVAGLVGTPYGAVYSATKAALIAATHSLRMEFADSALGFTAICPGFVHGAGMHELAKQQAGRAPAVLGGTTVEDVVAAIERALVDNPPEVIVNSSPLRPMIGLARAMPGLANVLTRWMSGSYMKKLADARRSA